jgi:alpha-galactosidase
MRKFISGLRAAIPVLTALTVLAALTVAGTVASVATGAPAARAENNGVGLTPAMGWSSWSFIRHDPTAAKIEAQAKAMKVSGLAAVGYQYVNIDDFWYNCPGRHFLQTHTNRGPERLTSSVTRVQESRGR